MINGPGIVWGYGWHHRDLKVFLHIKLSLFKIHKKENKEEKVKIKKFKEEEEEDTNKNNP